MVSQKGGRQVSERNERERKAKKNMKKLTVKELFYLQDKHLQCARYTNPWASPTSIKVENKDACLGSLVAVCQKIDSICPHVRAV